MSLQKQDVELLADHEAASKAILAAWKGDRRDGVGRFIHSRASIGERRTVNHWRGRRGRGNIVGRNSVICCRWRNGGRKCRKRSHPE